MSTAAQALANQKNAQLSTGPQTESGKRRAALNSTRHGFTGQVVLLTPEEAEPYRQFNEAYVEELKPVGPVEQQLVRSLIDAKWRLNQLVAAESALYALGYREYVEQHPDENPELAAAMARALTFVARAKEFDRLHRYEGRLQRQATSDFHDLRTLQSERQEHEQNLRRKAMRLHAHFTERKQAWNPAEFGFVWSTAEIAAFIERRESLGRKSSARAEAYLADV